MRDKWTEKVIGFPAIDHLYRPIICVMDQLYVVFFEMNDISLLGLDPDQVFRLFSRHPLILLFCGFGGGNYTLS